MVTLDNKMASELIAKIKDGDQKHANIRAVCDRVEAFLATVEKLRAEYPVIRARDRAEKSITGLI